MPLLSGDLGLASGAHDPWSCACDRRNVPLKYPRGKTISSFPYSASPGRCLFFRLKTSVLLTAFNVMWEFLHVFRRFLLDVSVFEMAPSVVPTASRCP